MSAVLFLNERWGAADGAATTVYAFDEAKGDFCAQRLAPEADTLLLWRSDRTLYGVERARRDRFTLGMHFLGHYA